MEIDSLPTEVLVRIFKYVSIDWDWGNYRISLRPARLVCRLFAAIGAQFLVQRAFVSTHHDDLEVPIEMFKHPVISKYVTGLICDDAYRDSIVRSGNVEHI